jgi:hypothetical protein
MSIRHLELFYFFWNIQQKYLYAARKSKYPPQADRTVIRESQRPNTDELEPVQLLWNSHTD